MVPTRERILEATEALFQARGFNGTSLKQVTEASGLPTGSVYHAFPGGKRALAAAVIDWSGARYQAIVAAEMAAAPSLAAAVRAIFDGAARVVEALGYVDPCPIGGVAREVASTDELLREHCARVFDNWRVAFTTQAHSAGLSDTAAVNLAATVVAALEGGFTLARTARDPVPLRQIGAWLSASVAAVADEN